MKVCSCSLVHIPYSSDMDQHILIWMRMSAKDHAFIALVCMLESSADIVFPVIFTQAVLFLNCVTVLCKSSCCFLMGNHLCNMLFIPLAILA